MRNKLTLSPTLYQCHPSPDIFSYLHCCIVLLSYFSSNEIHVSFSALSQSIRGLGVLSIAVIIIRLLAHCLKKWIHCQKSKIVSGQLKVWEPHFMTSCPTCHYRALPWRVGQVVVEYGSQPKYLRPWGAKLQGMRSQTFCSMTWAMQLLEAVMKYGSQPTYMRPRGADFRLLACVVAQHTDASHS